ncbi:MAG: hypothetical protein KatS3mg026_0913 [Bacteroidia bacterium]|nr:MAG: hypothetical protein KatS3mg026_0913 [Bacteroidia bacterium]
MRTTLFFAGAALLWAQQSPSWGRAQIDSAASIIPRYVVSPVAQTNTRLPYFAVLRLTGLEPNTWYRYVPRMDNSTTPPSTNNVNLGAGNPIFYNAQTQTFWRSTSPSLTTSGGYDTILTDANGEATLIFGLEPTGNLRFRTDGGNQVYVKVFLRSHDPNAPIDSAYVIGDKTPIQPLALRTTAEDTCGSFLYDSSLAAPGTLVFLYDSYGPHGVGERPLSGAVVEPVGIAWPGSMLAAYTAQVSTQQKRYGTLIPNLLPNGVRAIHYYSLSCQSGIFDQDGVWPSGISTVNPNNGAAALGLLNSPYRPLPPEPSNSCISPSINPTTGRVYTGYTHSPITGFAYEMVACLSFPYLPGFTTLTDSTSPWSGTLYALCQPSLWGSSSDSLPPVWQILPGAACQDPCWMYQSVPGAFFWRCFSGEAGYQVQNFNYYDGSPNYAYQTVTLNPLRVPKKVEWQSGLPMGPVSPGTFLNISVELQDSISATWYNTGAPNFSSCSPSVTLYLYDAQNNLVNTLNGSWNSMSFGPYATFSFSGSWPSAAGTYKLVVGDVPFPLGCCSGVTGGWAHSDTVQVTVSSTTSLPMQVRAEESAWQVTLPTVEGQLLLYDAQGRRVWQAPASATVTIPRQGLAPGVYTLLWQHSKGLATRKLLHP